MEKKNNTTSDKAPHNTPDKNSVQKLGLLAFTSIFSGLVAACASAPFISIVDKAITSNASGREPLWQCVKNGFSSLVKTPKYFFRQPSFLWIAGVYSGTYVVANLTQLVCEVLHQPWQYPKFVSTSFTNVALSMLKDRAFAKMFAKEHTTAAFPVLSLGLFAARDSMTILASFNLPPIFTPMLVQATGWSLVVARAIVQLVTPLAMQIFSVPLHLYALDLYNRPGVTAGSRAAFIQREYAKTVLARWGRILPAFGIGGVINLECLELTRHLIGVEMKH